jgi:precorrin-6B C5,15-methyltransferase / cobalt-precorrin-6B C5,C15-methyltransferase
MVSYAPTPENPTPRWLAILGIGEDGVEGMPPAAQALVRQATLVVGGTRHLALAEPLIQAERLPWPSPLSGAIPAILARRPAPVAVLASGDPFCDGIGALLAKTIPMAEILCLPAPSSYALARARLGWPMRETATISFCGRPLEPLAPLLSPGRRILCLSADATTPAAVARYLTAHGFGPSQLHVLEALGGANERIRATTAESFDLTDCHPLNLVALRIAAGPQARIIPLSTGLPDALFEHDGQITKREIRAITISALAPRAGELLWDVGCGSGSIAIEWMLRHAENRAIGIERDPTRALRAARNAASLGVPGLTLTQTPAPEAFRSLPTPDAIFFGGGAHLPGAIDSAWRHLRPGGRLIANAVALETEAALFAAQANFGGSLTRISVERLEPLGRLHGFRPGMTVTQWATEKP